MSARRKAERALWVATAVAALLLVREMRSIVVAIATAADGMRLDNPETPHLVHEWSTDSLEAALEGAIEYDPFRRFAVGMVVPPTLTPAPARRPILVLRGVLGGPPWDAIVEGIPGRNGAMVVRAGDIVNGVAIRDVRVDTAIVQAGDTTWTLTLRRP